jgi:hypothetical protein
MTDRAPIDPQVAVDYMLQTAPRYAAAKAKRVQLEEFRKSKKSEGKTVADREASAYAHPEYIELLNGLEAAVEAEELFRWKMKAAELQVEIWRSQEASSRAEGRAVR